MENPFVEDKLDIREIFNIKGLYYEVNYEQQKVENDPIFKKWLESQKRERGENGRVCYCRGCKLFYYFINEKELTEAKKTCQNFGYM